MINKDRIIKTFCEIVAIDSPSGEEESMAIDCLLYTSDAADE